MSKQFSKQKKNTKSEKWPTKSWAKKEEKYDKSKKSETLLWRQWSSMDKVRKCLVKVLFYVNMDKQQASRERERG